MKAHLTSWLIIISLCLSSGIHGAVPVPTIAAVLIKNFGGIIASYSALDFMELVAKGNKLSETANVDSHLTVITTDSTVSQIKEIEQPILPLMLIGVAFLGIIVLDIKINKQLQDATDTRDVAEKA